MIQLFETSSIDSNCNIGVNDKPFSMPVIDGDHIFLRLQVPYYLITANGGGMPVAANLTLRFTDVEGANTLCNLNHPSGNQFRYTFSNNAQKRVAEYRFMIPLSFAGIAYKTFSFSANYGDEIVVDNAGEITTWVYGVEPTPYPFIDYVSGKIAIRKKFYGAYSVKVNGSIAILSAMFTNDQIACLNETCFRVAIDLNFAALPSPLYTFYTKTYQKLLCDEDSLFIESKYSDNYSLDCGGHYNVPNTGLYANKHYLRIPADIDKLPSNVLKTYNAKCFQYRSEVTKRVQLKSDPMPDWFQDACETLMLGTNFKINGVEYQIGTENIFENNDLIGSVFQNINLPLTQCKCENVFVC